MHSVTIPLQAVGLLAPQQQQQQQPVAIHLLLVVACIWFRKQASSNLQQQQQHPSLGLRQPRLRIRLRTWPSYEDGLTDVAADLMVNVVWYVASIVITWWSDRLLVAGAALVIYWVQLLAVLAAFLEGLAVLDS